MAKIVKTLPPRNAKVLYKAGKRESGALANLALCQRSFLYDFAVDGGAIGTISFKNAIPDDAAILRIFADIQTVATSGGAATYQLKAGSTNLTSAIAYNNSTEGINDVGVWLITNAAGLPSGLPAGSPTLGFASPFAVLGASTVTNTGSSVITGDLGLYPGTSVTGFPPGTVSGTQHINNATAQQAQTDALAAYVDLASRTVTTNYSGTDLGTLTLLPGVYKFNTSAQLTGTLTLNAAGNPNAVWIFQIGSTLTTASSSIVSVINGGSGDNVYWQVGSSATLGTSTAFKGTIIADQSITATTSATVLNGRLIALNAAVTLDTNTVTVPSSGSLTPEDAIKLDGTSELKMAIAIAALTAGKVRFTIEYLISK